MNRIILLDCSRPRHFKVQTKDGKVSLRLVPLPISYNADLPEACMAGNIVAWVVSKDQLDDVHGIIPTRKEKDVAQVINYSNCTVPRFEGALSEQPYMALVEGLKAVERLEGRTRNVWHIAWS